jgi:hypothetical protein
VTPSEALDEIKAWRKRDPDANAAVRALLDSFLYHNLDELFAADPDSVLLLHESLVPLMESDRMFELEDTLNRQGRREVTGRVIELAPPLAPPTGPRHPLPRPRA